MTYPRSQIAPPDEPGFFHVISRCVRRAFLCGDDKFSGENYDHRRQWIEDRIHLLADSFAVSVYSYAVMSNHSHIVLHVDPNEAQAWPDEEVEQTWTPSISSKFPRRRRAIFLFPVVLMSATLAT